MPQFTLNTPPRRTPPHAFCALDDFAKGYVEAMFFTNGDTGEDDENLLNDLGVDRLTKASVAKIKRDCDAFLTSFGHDGCFIRQWLDRANAATGYDDEQAGRDFWFTRQGHGVGFWSRDEETLPGAIGEVLDEIAKGFGETYVSVSRGWVHA